MRFIDYATQYDHRMFSWVQQRQCRQLLVACARKVSLSADGYLYLLCAAALAGYREFAILAVAVMGISIERAIYFVLKNTMKRSRPPQKFPGFSSVIKAADKFSFPSGHTSCAFFVVTIATIYAPMFAWLYIWATMVGASRVVLGVHFPSDTVAGAVLGSGIGILSVLALASILGA